LKSLSEHIFHHEHLRLEVFDVFEILLVECSPGIVNHAFAVVRAVALANLAEPLAGGAAGNQVDPVGSDPLLKFSRRELGEVGTNDIRHVGEIGAVDLNGLRIEVDRGEHLYPGAMQPQRKAAASREQIDACQCLGHGEAIISWPG